MKSGTALLCGPGQAVGLSLPPTCPDPECRRAGQDERDAEALRRAIERGVIDP